MNDKKNFSIIIPAHKSEKDFSLLKKLKSKFPNTEIILSIDSENELSLDQLSEINLNVKKNGKSSKLNKRKVFKCRSSNGKQ